MRRFIGVVAVLLLAACSLTLAPLPDGGRDCGYGSNNWGSRCDNPVTITITIGPSRQYTDNSDALCYQFSPMVASVKMGGSYVFQNNSSSTITIMGSDQSRWATVAAGSTSAALNFSAAGTYAFGVQGCQGAAGTAWYGVLQVTN